MANDTKIPLFRRFVIQNFPYIEQDFDALTDYQLISKIVEYLNQVITSQNGLVDDMNDLETAFNTLKDYVDHYFENLDVQDEINNKIDSMVESGEFQNILDAYVEPQLNELNNNLTNAINNVNSSLTTSINTEVTNRTNADASLQSQIASLASGSPLAASSTAGMTDTTKIYVNTTDGKWYFYDGDSWEIGGTYQSTAIANGSIDITKLDGSIFNNAIKSTATATLGGLDSTSGEVTAQDNRVHITITGLTECDTFYVKLNDSTLIPTSFFPYHGDHFNQGQTFIPSSFYVETIGDGMMIKRGNYDTVKIIYKKADGTDFTNDEVSALSMDVYQTTQYENKNVVNTLTNDGIAFEYGGINDLGGLVTNTIRARSQTIKNINNITGSKFYKIKGLTSSMYINRVVTYLNGVFVAKYNQNANGNPVMFSTNHLKVDFANTFNEVRVVVSKYGDSTAFTDSELSNLKMTNISIENRSKWNGKKYAALGDSITYGFIPRNYTGYPGQLNSYAQLTANDLGMTFVNAGVNGNTVAPASDAGTPMCERYTDLPDDADLITVMGGTNDIRKGVTLGQFSDRTDATFYGALHILLGGLYKKYFIDQGTTTGKTKHVVVLTPPKLLQSSGGVSGGTGTLYNLEPWCNAIKEVAEYYSFPVFDMYNLSGINPHLNETVHGTETGYTGYYNPYITDGTHPTQEGAEIMAKAFEGFIETLI